MQSILITANTKKQLLSYLMLTYEANEATRINVILEMCQIMCQCFRFHLNNKCHVNEHVVMCMIIAIYSHRQIHTQPLTDTYTHTHTWICIRTRIYNRNIHSRMSIIERSCCNTILWNLQKKFNWILEYLSARVLVYSSTWVFEYLNTQVHEYLLEYSGVLEDLDTWVLQYKDHCTGRKQT